MDQFPISHGSIDHGTLLIDIATRNVIHFLPDNSVGEAAGIMAAKRISSIVVTDDDGHPLGIVTERNMLQAMQSGCPPEKPLRTIMSSPVITVPETITCLDAYQICLRDGIRHLVIVDQERLLLGVVSETDFHLHIKLTTLAGRRQVASAMNKSLFSLLPEASLQDALDLMQSHRDTCVVVVEADLPVGIVTERDIVRLYSCHAEQTGIQLKAVMTSPVLTVSLDDTINEAAEKMLTAKVRHLVAVDRAGRAAGVVSEHDLTQTLALNMIDDKLILDGAFLHTLVNTIPDMVWLKDVGGVYLACNSRFERFFGAKESEIVGKSDDDFLDRELAASFREYDRKALDLNGASGNEEWVQYADDGHRELLEILRTPMRDSQGHLIGVLSVARDITARKRIEDALYFVAQRGWKDKAENFFEALVQHLGKALNVDYVVVDKLSEDPEVAETVALYAQGNIVPNLRYNLKNTPCENVIGRAFCFYQQQVGQLFPKDELLTQMGVESYAGMPLWDSAGKAIGLIAVMDSKPLADKASISQLLELMATRAAAELERQRSSRDLQAREREFRTLAENIPDNVIRYDSECRVQYMNPALTSSLAEEILPVIGKNPVESHPGHDEIKQHQLLIEQVISSGVGVDLEMVAPHPSGEKHTHHVLYVAERDSAGKIVGALGIGRDITERKRMENQLDDYRRRLEGQVAEESTKLHALIEQSLVGNYIIQDGYFRYVNSGFAEMFGYDAPEQIVERIAVLDMVVAEDREMVTENIQKRLNDEVDRIRYSFTGIKRDGNLIIVDVHGREIEYQGKPAIIGTLVDITEMRRSKEELERMVEEKSSKLRQSEELLRTLIEAIPDAIQFKDAEGRWLESNFAARAAFGLDVAICHGKSDAELSEIVDPSFKSALLHCDETDKQAWEIGNTCRVEEVIEGQNGEKMHFDVIKVPLYHADGKPKGMVIVGRDVSELRRAQEVVATRERELRTLTENSPEVIIRYDKQCRRIFANPAYEKITGKTIDEMLGKSPIERWSVPSGQQGAESFQANVRKVLESGQPGEWEINWCRENGEIVCMLLRAVPEFDQSGQVESVLTFSGDISDRKRAEEALRSSLKEYSELVQRIPVGVFKFRICQDGIRVFDYVSRRWCELLDVTEQEVMADPLVTFERIHEQERKGFILLHEEARKTLEHFVWEGRIIRKNGEIRWLHIEAEPTLLENGDVLWDGIQYDITDRRMADEALSITASVFDTSQEAILITDAANVIVDVNPAFTYITGYSREEVIGRNPSVLSSGRQDQTFFTTMWQSLNQNGTWRGEVWNRRKSGEIYAELLSISAICDDGGKIQRYVGVFSDISYLKEHEAELSRVAHYDALTGIPNRVLLADRLKQAIAKTARDQSMVAICYLDLDGFKFINDTMGHDAGDQVLIDVARRIGNTLRGGDTVARLGGDEFVVLLRLEDGEECGTTLDRLLAVISQPITVKGKAQMVSASIGVCIYPLDNEDSDTLLRHADQAMYLAKQSGKNCFSIYDPELDLKARSHNEFVKGVCRGLEQNQFELYYQPKIDLRSKRMVGVEALIRWHHPQRGLIYPIDFMRAIENTDLDIEIGKWVISTALDQIRCWQQAGLDTEVSINISAYHLESQGFTENLRQQLGEFPAISPGRLQIEVLETAALNDLAIVRTVIESCRTFGVGFSLDDFGTGYSSLSYLSKLPVDVLKIDQSFVRDMLEDNGDKTIVQGIIALAKAFSRKVVAEGIETEEHYQALLALGCEMGQGYHIAYPMPAKELANWRLE